MNNFLIKFVLLALLSFLFSQCTSDYQAPASVSTAAVNWADWNDWDKKQKQGNRPALVWIHTSTCENCIKQETDFFSNPIIVNYLNEHFHTAHLLDTYTEDIKVHGNTFRYIQRYADIGYHDLAYHLTKAERLKNQLPPYPSIALLDKDFNLIFPITKMIDVQELEMLLSYVKTEAFKNMKVGEYKAQFQTKLY